MSEHYESLRPTDPVGHQPMEYRDGKWYLPGNVLAQPDFQIGPEAHHRTVFIEYERTFGRGIAYHVTHFGSRGIIKIDSTKEKEIQDTYRILRGATVFSADKEKSDNMIEALKTFRRTYPELYTDVHTSDEDDTFTIVS